MKPLTEELCSTETTTHDMSKAEANPEPLGMCNWGQPWPGIQAEALAWYRQGTATGAADASPDQDVAQAEHALMTATSDHDLPATGTGADDSSQSGDTNIFEEGETS